MANTKQEKKRPRITLAHYLSANRLSNWFKLLHENGWKVGRDRIPQLAYCLLVSIILTPFTLLERLIFAIPIHRHKIKKDPLFILGHWRSGTTYLQNLLSRDPQFGWCDPVSTTTFNNSYLLGWFTGPFQSKVLVDARPMDNLNYTIDYPMEDVFALNLISPRSFIHLVAFPENYRHYLDYGFVENLPASTRAKWAKETMYVLRKISLRKGGKQLMLKSPEHTCRVRPLLELFPNAVFVNIHRDPYSTIRSTINTFIKQYELHRIGTLPDGDFTDVMEDFILELFERTYRYLFECEQSGALNEHNYVNIAYADLENDPEGCLRHIYDSLGLDGFEEALPYFREHIESQKGYVKNRFSMDPNLRRRINERLGFYFEHYGYEMLTD